MKEKIKKFFKSESGFTLIELLVVIGIIAILATIGAVNFSGARAKARDGKKVADLSQIQASIEASAAGTSDGLYPTVLPTDLTANPFTVDGASSAYCYYRRTDRTAYIVSAEILEDTGTGAVRDQGQDVDIDTSALYQAPLEIGTGAGTCAAIAATNAPDCDDSARSTLCRIGTVAQ